MLLADLVESVLPIYIVVTLRADFYDRPLEFPEFARLMVQNTVPVLSLTVPELEQAILAPAINAGLAFEDGLVPQIIADVTPSPVPCL